MPDEDASREPLPTPTRGDHALTLTRAAVSAIPVVGSPAAELMGFLRAPLERRREEWWASLAARVAELEADGRVQRAGLAGNESFLDAAARATNAAVLTGSVEKRLALRNAVLHVALGDHPDEARKDLFINLVERFTSWHLRLLKVFSDAPGWATANGLNVADLGHSTDSFLRAAIPSLSGRPDYYHALWKDLHDARLVDTDVATMFTTTSNVPSWHQPRATELGLEFLGFIEEP